MMRLIKYWFVIPAVLAIVVIMALYTTTKRNNEAKELQEYREYLLSLSAEDVVVEYFKNRTEKNLPKIKETVIHEDRDTLKNNSNLEYVIAQEITVNEWETARYIESLEGEDYLEAKVLDVTYEIKVKEIITQSDGVYTWCYWMIKKSEDEPWLVSEFGIP